MSAFRGQHKLGGEVRPIIVNVMNFARGADGEPTLLSFDDARTLFHEFGHGLHGLLSDVTYPSIAGTSVVRDFVELPSQLYEHWLERPEVLQRFAVHAETGAPMPDGLVRRLKAARNFNQGFATVEYMACAYLDMASTNSARGGARRFGLRASDARAARHAARDRSAPPHPALPARRAATPRATTATCGRR